MVNAIGSLVLRPDPLRHALYRAYEQLPRAIAIPLEMWSNALTYGRLIDAAEKAGDRDELRHLYGEASMYRSMLEDERLERESLRLDAIARKHLVAIPLYSHSGQHVLIPAGARLLGETKPVQTFGETRLAVAFHRLLMPDGRTYRLDQFLGLNQIGDAGPKDRINQHYLATFGAAAAVGLISGLSQFLGSAGLGRGDGDDRTVIIAGSIGDATSQATLQVMNRFLNRLPTITIREGHRVKVYLTSDLELPAYVPAASF